MIDLYNKLNERIYENCKMYYSNKKIELTEKQYGIMGRIISIIKYCHETNILSTTKRQLQNLGYNKIESY